MKATYLTITILLLTLLTSCKKYVEIEDPKDQLVASSVFLNDNTATAAVIGIYSSMNESNYYFANVLTTFMGSMAADDFAYSAVFAAFDEFKNNAVLPGNTYVNTLWSQPYDYIYRANACYQGLSASTTLTPAIKDQLMGESLFVRAFCHFYLVNMFGDVPLITDTDVLANTNKPRTAAAEVYKSIIADLEAAKKLLATAYPGNTERTRPNKAVATALLARAYLYTGNFTAAEAQATEVISNTTYKLLPTAEMNNVFLKNSQEAIWQLQVVNTGANRNTFEGNTIISTATPLYRLTKGTTGLEDAFEADDKRRANWVAKYTTAAGLVYNYPFKYKVRVGTPVTEYSMVLRLAEQYLIRAEARAQQNKLSDAVSDLNIIRQRAGLGNLPALGDMGAVMLAIEKERRLELFTEWGHRWFDLKRWKSTSGDASKSRADDVLPAIKTAWKPTAKLWPIPTQALVTNPNLVQNPGYN
ncbi:RagB/SusD family nutrient uptake outer membrane protein [Mucilaginibacter daejeonensis]|uniref:RagB/SusD family nutrient uptake outer membrane protein n=1 Tax=Mucilaginibacter daejeonensis TaxID=398049 RepID=UPI001D174E0D|nr:RagB/SusD family nutrient uptake outer membrane protein [Mucilaginibacter daejeonensis]UEG54203.1 RagB/SusD family nutrient uptake outer membrane protein [Mucilaginibacter daejeonensis]